jgi:hypothetical protein
MLPHKIVLLWWMRLYLDEFGFVSEGSRAHIRLADLEHLNGRGSSRIYYAAAGRTVVTFSTPRLVVFNSSVVR